MEIVPSAVGESAGAIVFWEHNTEIGVAWPRSVEVIGEVKWGIGRLNEGECLVLYLFTEHQSIELYLESELPTTPTERVDVWKLVCSWSPEVLKIRFGETPKDADREITFLLPVAEGQGVVEKLRELQQLTKNAESLHPGSVPKTHLSLVDSLEECLKQSVGSSN